MSGPQPTLLPGLHRSSCAHTLPHTHSHPEKARSGQASAWAPPDLRGLCSPQVSGPRPLSLWSESSRSTCWSRHSARLAQRAACFPHPTLRRVLRTSPSWCKVRCQEGPTWTGASHPRLWTLGRGELPGAKWGQAKEAKDPGGLMPSSAHRSPGPWTEAGSSGPSPSRPWETASPALARTRDAGAALSLSERPLPAPPPCPSPRGDQRCPHPVAYRLPAPAAAGTHPGAGRGARRPGAGARRPDTRPPALAAASSASPCLPGARRARPGPTGPALEWDPGRDLRPAPGPAHGLLLRPNPKPRAAQDPRTRAALGSGPGTLPAACTPLHPRSAGMQGLCCLGAGRDGGGGVD